MAKYAHVLNDEFRGPKERARPTWLLPMALTAALFPILFEGGLIVLSKWRLMLGSYEEPRTPVLDWIAWAWRVGGAELRDRVPWLYQTGHWSPSVAVPTAIALALVASLFLRRGD